MRKLYLTPGHDQWLELLQGKKKIVITDIQSGSKTEYPFLSERDAKSNEKCWLNNQELRLPKTFMIDATIATDNIYDNLAEIGVKIPTRSERENCHTIMFHSDGSGRYVYATLGSEFTNDNYPTINRRLIAKVAKSKRIKKNALNKDIKAINTGIFAN